MTHPGEKFPQINLNLVDGDERQLPADCRQSFTLFLVYRGLHCSVCAAYLKEFSECLGELKTLGVEVIAASSDTQEKAIQARHLWTGEKIQFAYDLTKEQGKELGLYRSVARKSVEPNEFFEPGMYIILKSGVLLYLSLQNMPFGRMSVQELLTWIPKIEKNQIPPRGTLHY